MNHTAFPQSAGGESAPSSNAALWWVLTIGAERKGTSDDIVRQVVAPLSGQARTWGSHRFGFVRNFDSANPQVRFHLRAHTEVVDRVWKFAHAVAEKCTPQLGAVELAEQQSLVYPPKPGQPMPEAMEAVFATYGGLEGMQLVAEVSELTSDLAIWSVNRFPAGEAREALAALLLFDACHSMMWGPRSARWADRRTVSWDYYWDTHLHTCTSSLGNRAGQARRTLEDQTVPRIAPAHRRMAALVSEPSVDVWRKRWARAIDMYLFRADKKRVSRSAQQIVLKESMFLCNRMGVSLREEATLGFYARAWNRDLEKSGRK
ncbi:MAG: lantibiotic dehydratase C-terminal domain-containing protein [Arthrobacter sp.]